MRVITNVNKLIVPILIAIIFIIGVINISNMENVHIMTANEKKYNFMWLFKSLLYASYNLIILIPVLINLKKIIKNENQIFFLPIFTGIILFIISIIMFFLLANIENELKVIEMPAIYAIEKTVPKFKFLYGITILIAIFTTAISAGVSFANNVGQNEKSFMNIVRILCICSIFVSKIGFSNLVEILFPVFGILGLIQVYFILKCKL